MHSRIASFCITDSYRDKSFHRRTRRRNSYHNSNHPIYSRDTQNLYREISNKKNLEKNLDTPFKSYKLRRISNYSDYESELDLTLQKLEKMRKETSNSIYSNKRYKIENLRKKSAERKIQKLLKDTEIGMKINKTIKNLNCINKNSFISLNSIKQKLDEEYGDYNSNYRLSQLDLDNLNTRSSYRFFSTRKKFGCKVKLINIFSWI